MGWLRSTMGMAGDAARLAHGSPDAADWRIASNELARGLINVKTSGSSAEAVVEQQEGIAAVGWRRPRSGEAWRGSLRRGLAACPGASSA